jgi:hypothetical protein
MISRGNKHTGNKRRGNKRTKHRASIPDPTPKPESTISDAAQRFAEHAWQKRRAWYRRPHIARWEFEDPPDNVLEDPKDVERARKQNELAKKLGWARTTRAVQAACS